MNNPVPMVEKIKEIKSNLVPEFVRFSKPPQFIFWPTITRLYDKQSPENTIAPRRT
jgi:hypothetical protein